MRVRILAIFWLSCCTVSCYDPTGGPPLGYETGDDRCNNGIDDDHDGLIDCADKDCLYTSSWCGQYIPVVAAQEEHKENTPQLCHDLIDNDDNGNFDCSDKNCQALPEACCSNENSDAACSDGIDNDGNGYVDCADFACSQGMFVTVCGNKSTSTCPVPLPACATGAEDTLATCSDGCDNDANGFKDCADFSCSKSSDSAILAYCAAHEENTLATCSDHIDNDGNGYTDCADHACSQSTDPAILAYCASIAETSFARCSDGIDNDGNGYVDCSDHSCSLSTEPWTGHDGKTVADYCLSIAEDTYAQCTDGIDNDHNGYADCADYSCSESTQPWNTTDANGNPVVKTVADYCSTILENTFAKCTDGIDNDGNGHTDCQDFSCSRAKDLTVRQACQESLCIGTATADDKCSDGLDNDMDGFIDCADWDCSHNPAVTVCDNQPKVCGP